MIFILTATLALRARLARRLTTILPEMTLAEVIETMRIHRVAGCDGIKESVPTTRPHAAQRIIERR